MKTKTFMTIAVAATLLTACDKENEKETPWNGEIRLTTATASMDVQSRATQDLQLTQFDVKEEVSVFINEQDGGTSTTYTQPIKYITAQNGILAPTEPPYFPQSGKGVDIYACYPRTAADDVDTPKDFTIAADQIENDDYKISDLMLGLPAENPVLRTSNSVALTFTHQLSKINIKLSAGDGLTITEIYKATVSLKNILPTISFDPKTGITGAAKGTAADVTVMKDKGTTSSSAIIIPQTIAQDAAFIEVKLANGTVLTHKLAAATTFETKKQYTYDITVKLTRLTVNSTITPWDPIGTVKGEATL